MVGRDLSLTQTLGEVVSHSFHKPPGVHEDEGRAVFPGARGNTVVHLSPQLVRRDGAERLLWDFYR